MSARFSSILAAFVAIAALMPASASAQVERGELQLRVTDPTGAPLRTTGTLASEAPQLYRTFETDNAGHFTLQNLPFGIYQLRVDCEGFAPYLATASASPMRASLTGS